MATASASTNTATVLGKRVLEDPGAEEPSAVKACPEVKQAENTGSANEDPVASSLPAAFDAPAPVSTGPSTLGSRRKVLVEDKTAFEPGYDWRLTVMWPVRLRTIIGTYAAMTERTTLCIYKNDQFEGLMVTGMDNTGTCIVTAEMDAPVSFADHVAARPAYFPLIICPDQVKGILAAIDSKMAIRIYGNLGDSDSILIHATDNKPLGMFARARLSLLDPSAGNEQEQGISPTLVSKMETDFKLEMPLADLHSSVKCAISQKAKDVVFEVLEDAEHKVMYFVTTNHGVNNNQMTQVKTTLMSHEVMKVMAMEDDTATRDHAFVALTVAGGSDAELPEVPPLTDTRRASLPKRFEGAFRVEYLDRCLSTVKSVPKVEMYMTRDTGLLLIMCRLGDTAAPGAEGGHIAFILAPRADNGDQA